jgi:8-oxo-dGTP pyrophosphatase MutT (NUDIX family)
LRDGARPGASRVAGRYDRGMHSVESLEPLLRERLAGTLPGVEAQLRFATGLPRKGWVPGVYPSDARAAAALLLLYPAASGVTLPLTVRASHLRRHAGQISLPGGAADPGETLESAALREAREEIGVNPSGVRVLGSLTPVHVLVSGFTLHPVVGITDSRPQFQAAAHEVEEILEVSLEDLQDASRIRTGTRIREGVAVEYPYFDLHGHQVWGATAMILGEFICLLQTGRASDDAAAATPRTG